MTLERPKPANRAETAVSGGSSHLDVPQKDEPINSRNSPTTLNILTYSTDNEEFTNR